LASSPIVEVEARPIGNSGRYSGDNVLVSLRFGNGSEGTISYLANGDRSFSKERIEVFGGGSAAVLEDFRRLELVRNGCKEIIHSRWRQDKGHRREWAAFVQSVQRHTEAPIAFEELVCSTLATLRVDESVATGKRLSVNAAAFLDSAQRPSRLHE
jgi:predicted dehydrogenase